VAAQTTAIIHSLSTLTQVTVDLGGGWWVRPSKCPPG
jgi:hypothetical protein